MMKSLITSGLALAALSVVASAQSTLNPVPVQGPLKRAIINAETGVLTADHGQKAANLITTWVNTDGSGYYSTQSNTVAEWYDWGVMNSTVTDRVGAYQFGYATSAMHTSTGGPGVSLCTNFYNNATTWCGMSSGGYAPDFGVCWTALPGTTSGGGNGWLITVDCHTTLGFQLFNGTFGFALGMPDLVSGPLLCYASSAGGGADPVNGTEDVFDIYIPDVATTSDCGSYWFGGAPYNFSSWWLAIEQLDIAPPAATAYYCGSGVNPGGYNVVADPVLGGTFTSSLAHARVGGLLYGYASPLNFPYAGQEILVNFLDPFGELLGVPLSIGNPAVFNLGVPVSCFLVGFHAYIQPVSFGGGFDLHCAADCTVGF